MKPDVGRIVVELGKLERIQADLAGITSRSDTDRRGDLIALRRLLATQTALIGEIGGLALTEPTLLGAFRQHYSAMRSAAALHQAEWPAIRLGEDDDGYLRSAIGVREKNRAFVDWLRAILPAMERQSGADKA